MEVYFDIITRFYPLTLSTLIILIYLWNLLDASDKYYRFKSFLSYLIIFNLVIHFTAFYFNYSSEIGSDYFWIYWIIRDILLIVLSIIIFENKKLAILSTLFWISFGAYWLVKKNLVDELQRKINYRVSKLPKNNPSAELLVSLNDISQLPTLKNYLSSQNIQFEIEEAFPDLIDKDITDLDNWYIIDVESDEIANKVYEILKNSKLISFIEWNDKYKVSPEEAKSSVRKPISFVSINDVRAIEQWALDALNIDELDIKLKRIKLKKISKIFILDTGVDANHEDIKDNYFSVSEKYDRDTDKHGTHCAGIAAAVTNNQKGIASLNYNNRFCKITSITVLPSGRGTQEQIIDGMILAADLGADVISMSLGGPSNDLKQAAYEQAIDYCNKKGAIVVVAAGNDNMDAKYFSPASCSSCITVAAVDPNLRKASFSNYFTEQKYGIAAPGVDILSTVPLNKYEKFNGTSMATPFVAGIIGIMKSIKPDITTEEAFNILNDSGKNIDLRHGHVGNFIQPDKAIEVLTKKTYRFHWFIEWIIRLFSFSII